jgi:putative transposase
MCFSGLWQLFLDHWKQKVLSIYPSALVVERTFGWLNWCRRLSKDYERLPETSETFIYIAMIRIMVRRLA